MRTKDIELDFPVRIDGVETTKVTVRAPLVIDQLTAQKQARDAAGNIDDAEAEKALFARITRIHPDDMDKMELRDYMKLQGAYKYFLLEPLTKKKSEKSA